MDQDIHHIELVKKAQLGDKKCRDRLAELARLRLREYVRRLTLREDLTEDIVQECILEMFKVFGKLKRSDRFWGWLDGIAFNKVRSHYGRQWRHKTVSLSDAGYEIPRTNSPDGLADMITAELKEIVVKSMRQLRPRHRAVLVMRCYKGMKYSEIAGLMKCSEFGVQALFYRAKKALAKELSRHGLGKGSLLMALVLFGKMTAPSEAAAAKVSVTSAATEVGLAATLAGALASKTALVTVVTAGALGVGTLVATSGPEGIIPSGGDKPLQDSQMSGHVTHAKGTVEECWYYFPQRANGPVMMRTMKSDSKGRWSYCAWRQNEHANYYFDNRRNTVCIRNSRFWRQDLSVWRLPTDTPKLRQFLSKVEGRSEQIEYAPLRGEGLLIMARSNGDGNGSSLRVIHHDYILDGEQFRYDWPARMKVSDNRDAMHKRCWTYFRVEGEVNGEKVRGEGRMPFVYAASEQYRPWLRLEVGNRLRIVDNGRRAACGGGGRVMTSYKGGSFFKGLSRPWMGRHTIDTVRRDAAEREIAFETELARDGREAEVVLFCEQGKLVYTIDMQKDVVDKIAFSMDNGRKGELRFSYLQDISEAGSEFVGPRVRRSHRSERRASPGMLWLVQLAEGGLTQ
jgi:RNA polymerase sigma-70 factor (ECF subfamily)